MKIKLGRKLTCQKENPREILGLIAKVATNTLPTQSTPVGPVSVPISASNVVHLMLHA